MDPLQRILDKATQQGLLSPIGADPIRLRTSLYADDAALFVRPTLADLTTVRQLFASLWGRNRNTHQPSEIGAFSHLLR